MTERRSTLKSHTAQTDSCFLCFFFFFFMNSFFFLDAFMFSCAPVQFRGPTFGCLKLKDNKIL